MPRAEAARPRPGVCLLTETYYPVVGGGETQARTLAEDLLAQGFDVLVVTRRSSRVLAKTERIGGVTVYRTPPVGPGQRKRWGMVLACVPVLLRQRRRYDLVYVSGFKALGLTGVTLSRLLRKRCILKADSNGEMSGAFFDQGRRALGLAFDSNLFRIFLTLRNRVLRLADRFVAISSDIAEELRRHGVPPERIVLVTNSVDTGRFAPVDPATRTALRRKLELPADHAIVTYTGRLVSYKGLPLLLRVWRQVRHTRRDTTLLLVGSGGLDVHNCEAELREYVRAHQLQDGVHFTGDVRNVHEYLQASDLFVLPTEKEAFGIALIEAMACGLPVIATPTGGIKDIVVDGRNGLLVEAGSSDQLYRAIHRFLADTPLADALGRAARATVVSRYAREAVLRQYVELFAGSFDQEKGARCSAGS